MRAATAAQYALSSAEHRHALRPVGLPIAVAGIAVGCHPSDPGSVMQMQSHAGGQDVPFFDLAIVGGGAGGVLTAIHALRAARPGQRIVLVEAGAQLGEGVAYSTRQKEHLLNVPARGMSAFADAPGDFLDYVHKHHAGDAGREVLASSFARRRRYADYLRTRLQQAGVASQGRLQVIHARVDRLEGAGLEEARGEETRSGEPQSGPMRLVLASGYALLAHAVVLAIGNRPRALPAAGGEALAARQCIAAWNYEAIKRIDADAEVVIVGTGLSMADAVVSLFDNGHRGAIQLLSRHALMPLAHADAAPTSAPGLDLQALSALGARQRLRFIRARVREAVAAGLPWQSVFDALRPHGQALWQSLSGAEQRRFLRHAVRYWDIHRHRIAPQVHARLAQLQARGQLRLHRGRLQAVQAGEDARLQLHYKARDEGVQRLQADVVINASGVETRLHAIGNPLLEDLLARGVVRPGAHGLGIDTDADGHVRAADGHAHPRLATLGSLRIGSLWESLAVPELRVQAETAARALLAT